MEERRTRGIHSGGARCMAATPLSTRRLWSKNANKWRTAKWTIWSSNLGLIWADLGLGPKSKVVSRTMLYISYLMVMVIRAID
jgi:hypothetical protein